MEANSEAMTRPDDFTFRQWPFYWVARLNGIYFSRLEGALKAVELDLPSWRVLSTLYEEECLSVSEIADHAIIKLSTMTKIIQRMQREGLVSCRPREGDGRVTEVLITDKGREAGHKAWDIADRIRRQAFSGITPSQQRQIVSVLRMITENLAEG
jgi:DNA-binding MarR family transcriptional regulator